LSLDHPDDKLSRGALRIRNVYLFKDVMKELVAKGHKIKIVVRERENMVTPLLKHFGFKYEELYPNAPTMLGKAITMLKNDARLIKIVQKFKPGLMVGILSPYSAQASLVTHTKYVGFTDSENIFQNV
jgi:predicted glycosyltransferase